MDQKTSPSPDQEQALRGRTLLRWFMVFFVLMLITGTLPLPWKVLGLATGIAAVVMGIFTLVHLFRFKRSRILKVTTVLGLVITLLSTLGTGAMVALWPFTADYEQCMELALTIETKAECQENYLSLNGLLPTP
ncbi:hypothetical protein [Arthrobacter roseus]|uniref:hypothetical protein n=1 Tax=Arthrobacter roseus TaxID=136274 RepID=UPI001966237A|nr:hypothetical protein [Arthrobacter roseus]MBM7847922.1 uncharacterized membrane protein HdeD (DUF308 family) [Arthrobacter roseus]